MKTLILFFLFAGLILSSCAHKSERTPSSTLIENCEANKAAAALLQEREEQLGATRDAAEMQKIQWDLKEIKAAIQNNCKPREKENYDVFLLPFTVAKLSYHNRVDKSYAGAIPTVRPSSFWEGMRTDSESNLFAGFQRKTRNQVNHQTCTYTQAKSGYGVHPGFHVSCGDKEFNKEFKVKFGNEINSGPFNSRIFWSLGYNTSPIDYSDDLTVKYSRRLLKEFNSRKATTFTVRAAGKKVAQISSQKYADPFSYISYVTMASGQTLKSEEFRRALLRNPEPQSETQDSNYNEGFESQVESFVFVRNTLAEKFKNDDIKVKEIGPWSFDELDHADRTEIRGLQVLASWISNYDLRMDNNRLMSVKDKTTKRTRIRHDLVDVGAGLGNSSSLLSKTASNINSMEWTVTAVRPPAPESPESEKVELAGLISLEPNSVFDKISLADAQWMVRNICGITEKQLAQAFAASGLSAAEVRLGVEKMVSRRNKMVRDFDLEQKQSSCIRPVNPKLNYNPQQDGDLLVPTGDGSTFVVPHRNQIIEKGLIKNLGS
jgi:hypothetical protein